MSNSATQCDGNLFRITRRCSGWPVTKASRRFRIRNFGLWRVGGHPSGYKRRASPGIPLPSFSSALLSTQLLLTTTSHNTHNNNNTTQRTMAGVSPHHLATFAPKAGLLRGKNAAKDIDAAYATQGIKLSKSLTRDSSSSSASTSSRKERVQSWFGKIFK
ncbi:hypothetical protein DFS34DRAFT_629866 [Phlyctochytrium arcticum]|nr:hypothetical protein DFS34DRAFT_629866 [Phlyctochytrium arcticum]